jgi:hypothetical protein
LKFRILSFLKWKLSKLKDDAIKSKYFTLVSALLMVAVLTFIFVQILNFVIWLLFIPGVITMVAILVLALACGVMMSVMQSHN